MTTSKWEIPETPYTSKSYSIDEQIASQTEQLKGDHARLMELVEAGNLQQVSIWYKANITKLTRCNRNPWQQMKTIQWLRDVHGAETIDDIIHYLRNEQIYVERLQTNSPRLKAAVKLLESKEVDHDQTA